MTDTPQASAPEESRGIEGAPLAYVWFAIGLLVASLVGVGAGILTYLGGAHLASAVLAGGVGFGGAATLILLVLATVRGR